MIANEYLEKILLARVYDAAIETPLERADRLSERLGCTALIKREDLQPVFSFKIRGALNKISILAEHGETTGVIAASAGNHAQGVALAARRFELPATIVMPATTPRIKVDAVQGLGAEVILWGDGYDEASEHAETLAAERALTPVHPYDDPDVIAGQGTVAMELLRQHRGRLDAVFVPVGGGGLIAGVSAYLKALLPSVKVIGVEPADAACLAAAFEAGERVQLDTVGLFADGAAVRQVGEEPWRIAQECVDHVLTVDTDEICAAVRDMFDDTRSIAEPAGALAVAGLKKYAQDLADGEATYIAIGSGANMNFDRLRHVAERAEIGEEREALFAVTIPERPGAFKEFCTILGRRSITEFNYRYGTDDAAHIFVGVEIEPRQGDRERITGQLSEAGLAVVDLSQDEMAKLHIRFMVGGRSNPVDERLVRFMFPERPGALMQFLEAIGDRWNISLFHYRNHGAAFGRVLAGLQVAPSDEAAFGSFLNDLGYRWSDESENPAYALFLRE